MRSVIEVAAFLPLVFAGRVAIESRMNPNVYDFAGEKSATVAGFTPGIRRFGRGGMGVRP